MDVISRRRGRHFELGSGRGSPSSRMAQALRAAAAVAVVAMAPASAFAGSQGPQQDPCLNVEALCGPQVGSQFVPPAPALMCPCGPGAWVRELPSTKIEPTVPVETIEQEQLFVILRKAKATPSSASALVNGIGNSSCVFGCSSGALSISERAAFSSSEREYWEGTLPPCPRMVTLAAMGSATQAVGVATTAHLGCSASASSTLAGACSSLGDASAQLSHSLLAQAQFNSASTAVKVSGNIGAMISVESVSIQGSYSKLDSWEATGIGSATGTASFIVKPDRTYCAFTNKAVTKRAAGTVTVIGAAAVANGGSVAFNSASTIKLWVE